MCNLYNATTNRQAIIDLTRALRDLSGFNEPSRDVYPGYLAPVVRVGADGARKIVPLTWGMPSPPKILEGKKYDPGVTNIRNTASSHWRRWLGVECRCVVPVEEFAWRGIGCDREAGRAQQAVERLQNCRVVIHHTHARRRVVHPFPLLACFIVLLTAYRETISSAMASE